MTGRFYKVDGQRFPSVTTILATLDKPGLATWRGSIGNVAADKVSREATDHGTALHALVEMVNRGNRQQLGPVERAIVDPYVAWFDEHVSVCLAAEKLIISRRWKFAGTTDAIMVMRGDRLATIVDFKSSRTPLGIREWRAQTAAYVLAAEEEGIICERRIIVRMPKDDPGKLFVHELPAEELVVDQRAFLACLRLFNWSAGIEPVARPVGMRIKFSERSK